LIFSLTSIVDNFTNLNVIKRHNHGFILKWKNSYTVRKSDLDRARLGAMKSLSVDKLRVQDEELDMGDIEEALP